MRRVLLALVIVVTAACGGSKSPTQPPTPQIVNVAGNWTGNMESSNYATVAIELQFTQSAGTVTGTWATGSGAWNGSVSGTASTSNFTGLFTINAVGVGGAACSGTASVSGALTQTPQTIKWTSPGFTGNCTGMPLTLTWNLQRK
jgi:hypothetical protein